MNIWNLVGFWDLNQFEERRNPRTVLSLLSAHGLAQQAIRSRWPSHQTRHGAQCTRGGAATGGERRDEVLRRRLLRDERRMGSAAGKVSGSETHPSSPSTSRQRLAQWRRPDRWRLSSEQWWQQCGPMARGGVVEVRYRSIGAWGRMWRCRPRRRGPRWCFGAKSTATATLRPPELDKQTLRHVRAAQGSFLRADVVPRGGIEGGGGGSMASLHRNRGEREGEGERG
jgi:hypothetical protein